MLQTSTFANGLRLVTLSLSGLHTAALGAWLINGSRHESEGEAGYAHYLEHLLFRHALVSNDGGLAQRFDALGAQVNAHTGRELAVLHGQALREDLPELLALFSDMLAPHFSDDGFAAEREVLRQELALADSGEDELDNVAIALAWRRHPLARPILGHEASLAAATAARLRSYAKAAVAGQRLVIVAAGACNHAELARACAPLAALAAGAGAKTTPPVFTGGDHERSWRTPYSRLLWLLPAPAANEPAFAALVANHVLGGGIASRLFSSLRERQGLAYGVSSHLDQYSDAGLWWIRTSCEAVRTDACRQLVEAELTALAQDGPTARELDAAKRHLRARLRMEQDDPIATMQRVAREAIYLHRHPSLEEYQDEVAAVSADDVARSLARAQRDRLALCWRRTER
jgi:predicted Zn-dependent peptidase